MAKMTGSPVPIARQQGVAILVITVVILLVATIGTLMIGRVGLVEQKIVGTTTKGNELYSAAIGGLEYSANWLLRSGNYESLTFSDADSDGIPEKGDTAKADSSGIDTSMSRTQFDLGDAEANSNDYERSVIFTLMTDLQPIELDDADIDGDGMTNEVMNVRPVVVRVTSEASPTSGDTHLSKTVSVDVIIGGEQITNSSASNSEGVFNGPPLVIEGCVTASLTGNPSISYDISNDSTAINYAIATVQGGTGTGTDINTCIPAANLSGHMTFCELEDDPNHDNWTECDNNDDVEIGDVLAGVATGTGTGTGNEDPRLDINGSSLLQTIFGIDPNDPNVHEKLLALEAANPTHFIVVDDQYVSNALHFPIQRTKYAWNGNQWHANVPWNLPSDFNPEITTVGTDGEPIEPAVLFFDSSVDCPSFNGSPLFFGIIYYEKEVCSNNGWGGATVWGTVAKAGDLTDMNSNNEIIATTLDFGTPTSTGTGTNSFYNRGIAARPALMPGTWTDW